MTDEQDCPEAIATKMRHVEVLRGQGHPVRAALRQVGLTKRTYYRWRPQYAGLSQDEVKWVRPLLKERFAAWGLTPAERDVALFTIKGLPASEIAQLRQTSEGTVKAQIAAIYRKARVTGRPQLLSVFIEALMAKPSSPHTKSSHGPKAERSRAS